MTHFNRPKKLLLFIQLPFVYLVEMKFPLNGNLNLFTGSGMSSPGEISDRLL